MSVTADATMLPRGTPLYGQPSWWGDGDADDENSFKQESKSSGKKHDGCLSGRPAHTHVLLPAVEFISASTHRLFTSSVSQNQPEPVWTTRSFQKKWGEVNHAQTLEQTQAFLNLSPHLDSLAASKMDPLPGF